MIQKDSLSEEDDYNQIKGRNIYGKFEKNDLRTMLVKGNAESLYFNRNEESQKLETITKEIASDIEFLLEEQRNYSNKIFQKI